MGDCRKLPNCRTGEANSTEANPSHLSLTCQPSDVFYNFTSRSRRTKRMGGESGRVKEKMGETRKVERFLCKYLPLICNKCATDTAVNALASILLTHKERAHTCNKALHTRDSSWATPDPTDTFDNSATFRPTLICISNKRGHNCHRSQKSQKSRKTGENCKTNECKIYTNCSSTIRAQFLSIIFEVCFALGAQILYKCCVTATSKRAYQREGLIWETLLYKLPLNLMALITIDSYSV